MSNFRAAYGHGEEGQIMLLSIALGVVVLALVLVVASATALHIDRKRLLALADGAAAEAADAVDDGAYFGDPPTIDVIPLTDGSVTGAVDDYLASVPSPVVGQFQELAVAETTGTPDGTTAEVTLAALSRPPLVPWALVPWSDGIMLRVTASARAG